MVASRAIYCLFLFSVRLRHYTTSAAEADIITSEEPCTPETTTPFTLELQTDLAPAETSWDIRDYFTTTLTKAGPPYNSPDTLYIETYCLTTNTCHQFQINAKFGVFQGYYKLSWDGGLIQESSDFGSKEKTRFGGSCPTSSPTVEVIVPTMAPSGMDSVAPSRSPSVSRVPTDGPTLFADTEETPSFLVLIAAFPLLVLALLLVAAVVYMYLTGKKRREFQAATC